MKSQTIEEIAGHRKREVVCMRPYIIQDCVLDWDTLEVDIEKDIKRIMDRLFDDWKLRYTDGKKEEQRRFDEMFNKLESETLRPASWFNDDGNYKDALQSAIEFRKHSITRLLMSVIHKKRFKPGSLEGKICRPESKEELRGRENVEEVPTTDNISSEFLNSNYHPLYEVDRAGLTDSVKCMLEVGVGFRADSIAEGAKRVMEASRQKRFDTWALAIGPLYCVFGLPVWIYSLVFFDTFFGPGLLIFAGLIVLNFMSRALLHVWIFKGKSDSQPDVPKGPYKYAVFWIAKYSVPLGICSTLCALPNIVLGTLSLMHSFHIDASGVASVKPYYQFTYWPMLFSSSFIALPIVCPLFYVIYTGVFSTEIMKRIVPSMMKCFPICFSAFFPLSMYALNAFFSDWALARIFRKMFSSSLHDDYGDDVYYVKNLIHLLSRQNHSLGWVVTGTWFGVLQLFVLWRARKSSVS